MSESIQAMIGFNASNITTVTGVQTTTLDSIIGAVFVSPRLAFINAIWVQVLRSPAGGANVGGQTWGKYNYIHVFLDPTHAGPPYIMRISETIVPSFGANTGRIFFGFGEFTDTTDPLSLVGAGFYCDETGNWFALLSDALGDRERFDTAADTNQPRFLRMEMDGNLKVVRWYVDEVLVLTHTMATALDQIETGVDGASGVLFNDVVIQSPAGHDVAAYIASGLNAQMSIVTDEPEIVPPVPPVVALPSGQLTYQRIINLAVTRGPEFQELVLDDQQVVDELDALALELVQEGSDADHTAFQQIVNWNTDILPDLTEDPAPTDLGDIAYIQVPRWVNSIYSVEGVKSNGSKIEINIFSKESEIRDRPVVGLTVAYASLGDPRIRKPQALKVWNSSLAVWELHKDESNVSPGASPWDDIVDANLIVSGVPVRIGSRANLTNTVPLPFRALRPMAESFAITLGLRANKDFRWMADQRRVAEDAKAQFREFINMMDMATDEPWDPEIGMI